VTEAPGPDREEAHARRLYVLALVWGVVALALLAWFAWYWRP